jgi:DNA-binding IclR family transcriptional regulator
VVSSITPRLPEYGLTPTSLLAQVKRAQKLGYAVREMPTLAGVRSVGQALHNQSGIAFAALSVSAISSRMSEKRVTELATLLRNEVRLVEKQLANGADRR